MSRATDELVDSLHALTAESIIAEIKRCRENVDEDGKPSPLPIPPALLAQSIKFLKDNGVDAPQRAKEVADKLAAEMPDFAPEDTAQHGAPH